MKVKYHGTSISLSSLVFSVVSGFGLDAYTWKSNQKTSIESVKFWCKLNGFVGTVALQHSSGLEQHCSDNVYKKCSLGQTAYLICFLWAYFPGSLWI